MHIRISRQLANREVRDNKRLILKAVDQAGTLGWPEVSKSRKPLHDICKHEVINRWSPHVHTIGVFDEPVTACRAVRDDACPEKRGPLPLFHAVANVDRTSTFWKDAASFWSASPLLELKISGKFPSEITVSPALNQIS